MTDKEFDKLLKGTLEDYQPDYDQNSWEELENRIENEVEVLANDPFDDAVKAALGQFAVSNSNGDWDEMERRIIEDENNTFDQEVRENVENYQAPYDSNSWPVLDEKITEDERFRRRLIGAKILEIAAILIALITFVNVFPEIKNSLFEKDQRAISTTSDYSNKTISSAEQFGYSNQNTPVNPAGVAEDEYLNHDLDSPLNSKEESFELVSSALESTDGISSNPEVQSSNGSSNGHRTTPLMPLASTPQVDQHLDYIYPVDDAHNGYSRADIRTTNSDYSMAPVAAIGLPNHLDANIATTLPNAVISSRRRGPRLSIGASMDLNALYIPEEQLYADGTPILFSEKDLLATGYSAGLGIVMGDGAWSFEAGLFYSAKKYDPDRIIQVGKTFDVRTVDFKEISLHIVSVPLYAHWNFDRKGKTRFYAVLGGNFNAIADAHYDLITRNNFRSAPPGAVPDKKTDEEVARIREHILDGAKFSSKTYVTLAAGFGVEHYLGGKMSIFAQPMYNQQVPYFSFSDHNGKHLRYISMQLGTRVSIR